MIWVCQVLSEAEHIKVLGNGKSVRWNRKSTCQKSNESLKSHSSKWVVHFWLTGHEAKKKKMLKKIKEKLTLEWKWNKFFLKPIILRFL